jgi:hypothetical protein
VARAAYDQQVERRANRSSHHFRSRVAGDCLCSLVPERQLAFLPCQPNSVRKTIQGGFQELRAIGHRGPSTLFIGRPGANFTVSRHPETIEILLMNSKRILSDFSLQAGVLVVV